MDREVPVKASDASLSGKDTANGVFTESWILRKRRRTSKLSSAIAFFPISANFRIFGSCTIVVSCIWTCFNIDRTSRSENKMAEFLICVTRVKVSRSVRTF
ncbi:hypothetical protein AYI69_g30 [Smittium culicis]|uniref:Uncharacterized protein n=1 Tax=Smittium culicis TaxID=133412 RepID=A0A1R1YU96_9FUNG|nr:hypothetical protein AYI69_g30 [Smittium culicis]